MPTAGVRGGCSLPMAVQQAVGRKKELCGQAPSGNL
jgi:hypothetical protein